MLSLVRRLASLRQEDMAQMTGLSQSALSMLENGTRPLTHIDKITRLLDGLAVPPELVRLPLTRSSTALRAVEGDGSDAPTLEEIPPYEWESPLAVAKRMNTTITSNTDPEAVKVLQRSVGDIVARYEARGPHRMAPEAEDLRRYVQELLDGRQPPRQQEALFRLAAQASGLLGYMAVSAGRDSLAEAYCAEAEKLASAIGAQDLLMWIAGTRSLNAYYLGDFATAAGWADAGIDLAPGRPQAIRLLANGRARALGKMGDRKGVERALAEAEELTVRHRPPGGLTSCIFFAPYSPARTLANAATAHLALGDTKRVLECAGRIDDLVERSDSAWSRTLVRLDVATALLNGASPDVEHAMTIGQQVLAAGSGPPIRSVVQRVGELNALRGCCASPGRLS
ncbi:helix-turn-helix domain-containing protein [Streptomyces sp. 2323.1]|uniref:helix-turn-helix domain-containing protein n=1 Tax=Streptomyces sp. 2323.1 TaxID=1938841 RepID=UPI0013317E31|nr:helix-turn-helix transcriptional regulator [Streptomyces sp. 2323.1]